MDKCAYTDKVKSVVMVEDNNVNFNHIEPRKSGKQLRRERRKNEHKNK